MNNNKKDNNEGIVSKIVTVILAIAIIALLWLLGSVRIVF